MAEHERDVRPHPHGGDADQERLPDHVAPGDEAHPEGPGPQDTADDRTLADAGLTATSHESLGVGGVHTTDRIPTRDQTVDEATRSLRQRSGSDSS